MLEQELDKIWGGWKIDKILGEGAFGKVYKIRKEEYGHVYEAALKVIRIPQNTSEVKSVMNDGLDEKSVTVYFNNIVSDIVKEIVLMNNLKGNTNIVSYEDHKVVTHEDGIGWTIYIRMELLTPLFDFVRNNLMTPKEVTKLGIDICSALEVCRYENTIHRDIKPENIFVTKTGNYKLGDFGIARQMEKNNTGLSKKGTFTYMAPEVYKGEPYSENVDIYSLGIVLYRFLNNHRTPFLPAYPEMITPVDRENANVKRMAGYRMDRPCNGSDELAEIVLKACAYRSENRYQNASEMKEDLKKVFRKMELEQQETEEVTVCLPKTDNDPEKTVDPSTTTRALFADEDIVRKVEEEKQRCQEEERLRQEEEQHRREEEQHRQQKGPSSNRIKLMIAAVVAVIIMIISMIALLGPKKIEVPDLTNMTLAEVEEAEYKFIVKQVGLEFSDEIEKDGIILQSIEKGTKIEEGTEIEVVISKGKAVIVPVFTGMTLEEAEKKAEELVIMLKVEEEFSDEVEEGEVISQSIEEGTEIEENKEILIIVSKGAEEKTEPETTYVPKKSYSPKKYSSSSSDSSDKEVNAEENLDDSAEEEDGVNEGEDMDSGETDTSTDLTIDSSTDSTTDPTTDTSTDPTTDPSVSPETVDPLV